MRSQSSTVDVTITFLQSRRSCDLRHLPLFLFCLLDSKVDNVGTFVALVLHRYGTRVSNWCRHPVSVLVSRPNPIGPDQRCNLCPTTVCIVSSAVSYLRAVSAHRSLLGHPRIRRSMRDRARISCRLRHRFPFPSLPPQKACSTSSTFADLYIRGVPYRFLALRTDLRTRRAGLGELTRPVGWCCAIRGCTSKLDYLREKRGLSVVDTLMHEINDELLLPPVVIQFES